MKFLLVLALCAVVYAKHEAYIGWKSYYVGVATDAQAKALEPLIQKYELDFLSHPTKSREGVVLVKPQHQAGFVQDIEAGGITYRIHADDVKRQLEFDDQLIEMQRMSSFTRTAGRQLPYDNYQELEVIDEYLDYIGEKYPDVATVVNAAESFEGRPIKYIKISTTNFEDENKPVIFIDGGIHAREWISPPSVTWAIHKLVEDVTENDLLEKFDWILLPVVNPDGYKYTFTNERFWRKTRSTNNNPLSQICRGADGNRNFDFVWNSIGTSNSPCSDIYAGTSAFSEVETRVVRDILHEHLARMALYLTMHSFGSMILYPWGHDGSLSQNALGLHTVGVAMASVIQSNALPNFPPYTVGNSALVIGYYIAGSSEDYAHSIGVPLSYTYELPGLSSGWDGFHLPPQYIEQVCRETWEGIVVGARRAGDLFRK
ncbi:carboxypeptidase B [Helicoverpa zea]|uniref:Carboxypeptidase B n=2 Tax=Helicoverpa zea TaxID=7113 RepID=CBPB_HELZE|nr:carboxypeptidase B [Helicoverpa zea]Q3T905.1 RecName: Full=Carboxypeptidase B; Short=CPBHz; Flags: Precursor [Helicoverpa zea]CAJ30028.1 carboxypeptidase B precursor [Helicoverpa zea]